MKITGEIVRIASKYYKEGNSLTEIAELLEKNNNFKIHFNTLGYHLKKSGLKLRGNVEGIILRKRKHIVTPKLLENYKSINSIRELSRTFRIGRGTIKKILKENGILIKDSRSALIAIGYIKEKSKFVLPPQEKAYIYGLVLGDLTPVRRSNYTLKLITHSTHKTFMDLLQKTFEKYGITNYKETKNKNTFRFQSHVDLESFSFLLDSKGEAMPNWINPENFFDFLAGFIDSDGSVMLKRMGKGIFYGIRLFGQNFELLSEIKRKLEIIGFNSSIHISHYKGEISYHNGVKFQYNKDYYILETKRKQAVQLLKLIPIRHPEKILKRELIFKIYSKNVIHWNKVEKEIQNLRFLIKELVRLKTSLTSISP